MVNKTIKLVPGEMGTFELKNGEIITINGYKNNSSNPFIGEYYNRIIYFNKKGEAYIPNNPSDLNSKFNIKKKIINNY